MTDYGHQLQFGSFLTPSAERPDRVVDLAVLSENLGLDLATFQDHPYQPAFLDTWTLISFIAARTTTIHLAANVTNLPLRPAAVLARSVASLDRLSGGRIELGIGAGGFWDAIEAMGGRRLTPPEAVQALDEAIRIAREIWDTGARGGARVDGAFHSVQGAKRGPTPTHDVAVWVGAVRPRMLRLTGRAADGWLPSLAYVPPRELGAGNLVIDAAAEQAGRSPTDIRRMLNVGGTFTSAGGGLLQGPAAQWADELTDLALMYGTSAFILASDDPDDLRRFAAEVAPAVRAAVAAERDSSRIPDSSAAAVSGRSATATAVAATASVLASNLRAVPTPDDGRRRSAVRVWDESTRPTGPVPDPTRHYSDAEQAAGRSLVEVHDILRTELTELYDLLDQVAAGTITAATARSAISTMTVRQNNWTVGTYCESYCRVVTSHHSIEDSAVFPRLRRAEAQLAPVLDRLQVEHQAIHDVLEQVDQALVQFVSVPDGMPGLRAALDLLSDTLLSHLSYEERELVEPLARLGVL